MPPPAPLPQPAVDRASRTSGRSKWDDHGPSGPSKWEPLPPAPLRPPAAPPPPDPTPSAPSSASAPSKSRPQSTPPSFQSNASDYGDRTPRGHSADDSDLGRKGSGKGGKFGGRGKGGGGGYREVQVSKAMSLILRHSAAKEGIKIRPDGFCRMSELLNARPMKSLSATQEEVVAAVQNSDKKRFDLAEEAGVMLIRATQGHSMKAVDDDSLLHRLSLNDPALPKVCVHGTYHRYLKSILQQGLKAGGGKSDRNHVHFASYEPGDSKVISGMRYDCEVAIYLDLRRAIQNGVPFFLSKNEVVLSPGINGVVSPEFISSARDLKTGQMIPVR